MTALPGMTLSPQRDPVGAAALAATAPAPESTEAPRGRVLTKAEIEAAAVGDTIAWGWMRPHPVNGMPFGSIWKMADGRWEMVPVEVRKATPHTRGEGAYFDPEHHPSSAKLVGIVWSVPRAADIPVHVVVVEPEVEG